MSQGRGPRAVQAPDAAPFPSSPPGPARPAEATRRGLGAALLRKPAKLQRLVAGIIAGSPLPVTVKIRLGEKDEKINAPEVGYNTVPRAALAVQLLIRWCKC